MKTISTTPSCAGRSTGTSCKYVLVAGLIFVGLSFLFASNFKWSLTPINKMQPRNIHGSVRRLQSGDVKQICDKKVNLMFVKVHKAGGTTTTCILQRFGYEHNLTFVLPFIKKQDIGWPHIWSQREVLPSADGTYNLLVDHSVYHRPLLDRVMPFNTVYLATLRQPLSHLRSTFNWYHLQKSFTWLKGGDLVASFLKDPRIVRLPIATFDADLRQWKQKPYFYTKNLQSYDYGFPNRESQNQSFINEFVSRMSREFDLVFILEYYHECLVLLRRMMCWTLKDILYDLVPKHFKSNYKRSSANDSRLEKLHRDWSNVDYQLYDHFNATLWKKIQRESDDFHQEVRHFEKVLHSAAAYCVHAIIQVPISKSTNRSMSKEAIYNLVHKRGKAWVANETAGRLTIAKSAWNDEFDIDPYLCLKLKMEWWDWETVLKKKYKLPANVTKTVRRNIQYPVMKTLDETLMREVFHVE